MEESTTFDEAFVGNEAKFPSYTLCPVDNFHSNNSIESFEDVTEEIENVKRNFKINYAEFKQYEETKRINETYNQSLNNDWYFAPKTSPFPPHETVVCLIMAPYRAHKNNPDWYYTVSHSRHVGKGGGQGGSCPPDIGGSKGAARQQRRAGLQHAPQDFVTCLTQIMK